jgi:hypothetical protein
MFVAGVVDLSSACSSSAASFAGLLLAWACVFLLLEL